MPQVIIGLAFLVAAVGRLAAGVPIGSSSFCSPHRWCSWEMAALMWIGLLVRLGCSLLGIVLAIEPWNSIGASPFRG